MKNAIKKTPRLNAMPFIFKDSKTIYLYRLHGQKHIQFLSYNKNINVVFINNNSSRFK